MGNVPATCIHVCVRARVSVCVGACSRIRVYVDKDRADPARRFRRKKAIKRAIIILERAEIHGRAAKKLTSFEPSLSARYDSTSYVFAG